MQNKANVYIHLEVSNYARRYASVDSFQDERLSASYAGEYILLAWLLRSPLAVWNIIVRKKRPRTGSIQGEVHQWLKYLLCM